MIYTAAVVIRKNKNHFDLSIVSRYEMTLNNVKEALSSTHNGQTGRL